MYPRQHLPKLGFAILTLVVMAVARAGTFTLETLELQPAAEGRGGRYEVTGLVLEKPPKEPVGERWSLAAGLPPGIVIAVADNRRPPLGVALDGGMIVVAWPARFREFILERTDVLEAPGLGWKTVTEPPGIVGDTIQVRVPVGTGSGFFRLRLVPVAPKVRHVVEP